MSRANARASFAADTYPLAGCRASDIALLMSEWDLSGMCLVCRCQGKHDAGCAMDLALAERAFSTQAERDAARKRITPMIETLPPPPPLPTEPAPPEE